MLHGHAGRPAFPPLNNPDFGLVGKEIILKARHVQKDKYGGIQGKFGKLDKK